jgi:hypothetical protein
MAAAQTASSFCLHQWGFKPTLPDRRNPADLKTLTLTSQRRSPAAMRLWWLVELMYTRQGRLNSPPA